MDTTPLPENLPPTTLTPFWRLKNPSLIHTVTGSPASIGSFATTVMNVISLEAQPPSDIKS